MMNLEEMGATTKVATEFSQQDTFIVKKEVRGWLNN